MKSLLVSALIAAALHAQVVISAEDAAAKSASIPLNAVAPGSIVNIQVVRGGPVSINLDPNSLAVKLRPMDSSKEYDAPRCRSDCDMGRGFREERGDAGSERYDSQHVHEKRSRLGGVCFS